MATGKESFWNTVEILGLDKDDKLKEALKETVEKVACALPEGEENDESQEVD
jgi:hypothetical protein